jgi:hypothetical protein
VLGLVIINHEAGVNDAGDPAQQRQQKAKDETEDAAGHQNGNRRKNDAEKVAKGFHGNVELLKRYIVPAKKQITWKAPNFFDFDALGALGMIRDARRR